ncbi:MAG: hypothetical protein QOJ27_481 [Sphingomonadales bacterium]|nr:hypothetical protein [Sphingomonadales bacterium]
MFERLTERGAELAARAAQRRRSELAETLRGEAPAGIAVTEVEEGVVLSGRGLGRRLALEAGLRWLVAGRGR